MIPPWMLALPRLGCINLHASLLPRYRGAAPIQWAVAMGDVFTGNTTMLLEEGPRHRADLAAADDRDWAGTDCGGSVSRVGKRRAALVETLAGLAEWNDPPEAAEPRRRDLRPVARPRRRPNGFCRAYSNRALQPLARFSTVARCIHHVQREKADRSSLGGRAVRVMRRIGRRQSPVGFL